MDRGVVIDDAENRNCCTRFLGESLSMCMILGIVITYFTIFGAIGMLSGITFKLTIMLALWTMTLEWGDIILYYTLGGFCLGFLACPYVALLFRNR